MYPYEGMFLVDPTMYAADSEAVAEFVRGRSGIWTST